MVKSEKCEVIVLMEKVTGRLEITNKHIYFFVDQHSHEKKDLIQCQYKYINGPCKLWVWSHAKVL